MSSVERERAKVICLGTMYGMGLPAAAGKLQIPLQLAQNILNSFYLKFKNVKRWIQFIKRYFVGWLSSLRSIFSLTVMLLPILLLVMQNKKVMWRRFQEENVFCLT